MSSLWGEPEPKLALRHPFGNYRQFAIIRNGYHTPMSSQHFSPLDQIDTGNATQPGEGCRVRIDGPTSFHAGLIMANGVIYTSTELETVALGASSCAVSWSCESQPE